MSTVKVELAQALAAFAHDGQTDKGGNPYIGHPVAVAAMIDGEDCKVVALLHDVLEDTAVEYGTLSNLFGKEIADAVDALTRKDGETYEAFIERVCRNSLARVVKLADLEHNMNLSRIPNPGESDLRRIEKYKKAHAFIENAIAESV